MLLSIYHIKYSLLRIALPMLFTFIPTFFLPAFTFAEESSSITTQCDKALYLFWKGKLAGEPEESLEFYLQAIDLCPGYIRPYELAGNIYRKQSLTDQALDLFKKAADLGTHNYKLYYHLAKLLFERGDLDEAYLYVDKSLNIRADHPASIRLKRKVEEAADSEGPKLIIYEPEKRRGLHLVYSTGTITVRGLAADKSNVSWVKINGKKAALDKHGNFFRNVPIQVGENTLLLEAVDGLGNYSRLSIAVIGQVYRIDTDFNFGSIIHATDLYTKSYAIVVGIDRYENWPFLEFAAADAVAVREMLQRLGFDDITLLLNEEATQRRILTELFESLPSKVERNDRVLFYFAGHGQTYEMAGGGRRGYIIPADAELTNYMPTALSMDQIRSLTRYIPAKHILYVMDSCYSGLGFNRSAGVSPGSRNYLRKISSMRAVQIVTAGGKGEQVQEKEGHGLFTTFFLQSLRGDADLNKDGVVTGTELGAYLRPAVSNASNQAQTPLFGRLEGEGEFIFLLGP